MRTLWSPILALALAPALAAGGEPPWHPHLAYPGGGTWHCRVPVTVSNRTGAEAAGRTVELAVGEGDGELPLVRHRVASLRVCDPRGGELLYDLTGPDGEPKRQGTLAPGDRLLFGVECPAGATAVYYVYSDNPQAWPVPDFLGAAAPFANGGFEQGEAAPRRWQKVEEDDEHRLAWTTEEPHGGKRCVRCTVEPEASPSWVKWAQRDIAVLPDADYRFQAWVRARGAEGAVGWFIHVHGQKPMVVNRVLDAGEGTYPWRQVETTVHTPPDAVRATVGTVLRGTGTAWYDDARFELLAERPPLEARAGPQQRRTLAVPPVRGEWRVRRASHRVEVRVRNWSEARARPLVFAHAAELAHALPLGLRSAPCCVVDPLSGERLPAVRAGDRLLVAADLAPRAEKTYHAYLPAPGRQRAAADFADLVASEANMVSNPGFELGDQRPATWPLAAENDPQATQTIRGSRDRQAHSGTWCARLEVPPQAPRRWSGWRQGELPVQPRTTYLYGAMLRCQGVEDGSVQLHGHFHNADGELCEGQRFFAVGPAIAGTQDWTLLMGTVETPPDCASVELHLTMNAHGTVWHDDVFFAPATAALVGPAEARRSPVDAEARQRGFALWTVDPLVKVFPDSLPQDEPRELRLAAARGEWEPLQLVLRGFRDLDSVTVAADVPRGADGRTLPPIELHRVGYVPVDHPSSYYRVDVPAWYRKLPPRGRRGCDGWAGLWPDPLPPYRAFDLAAHRTQPLWLTVRVPAHAEPGTYRSSVAVQPANAPAFRVPLTIEVWDFALPRTSGLKVVYDFREHFLRRFGRAGPRRERLRAWYEFLARRRLSPGLLPSPRFSWEDGKATMDAEDFDWAAGVCLDELGMNVFYSPRFFYAFGWAREPRKIFGLEPFSDDYVAAYTGCLKLFMDHLRARGWADEVVLYVSDEPHFRHDYVRRQMVRLCEMIHGAEPDLPIYSSTWRYCPQWAGHITLWGAGPHGSFPPDVIRQRQEAGDTFWFTTDGHMCTDTPYLAIERLLPWLCWKYGVEGYEFWGVNWYTYDPWEVGWHRFISQSSDGETYYFVRYPNGDGYLAYPPGPVGADGPVSSIRLEQAREGVEDYEYLALLDRLLAEARQQGRWPVTVARAQRVREEATGLVEMPNRGGRYSTALLPDPHAVGRMRRKVAEAILDLRRRLRPGR
ncbi:MAG: glycoside hydrolase domain-containing protein [Candidatus Brocadiia bacterium]